MSERRTMHQILHAGERRTDLPYEHFLITDFPPQLGHGSPCWKLACRLCPKAWLVNKPSARMTLNPNDVLYLLEHAAGHERGKR
jgi:hypothetical protein